jgi:hypothetical protein
VLRATAMPERGKIEMQEFMQAHSAEIWGGFAFLCFYIALSSILSAIRDSANKIVGAITSLELALTPIDHDDHPMYRDPYR